MGNLKISENRELSIMLEMRGEVIGKIIIDKPLDVRDCKISLHGMTLEELMNCIGN